MNDPRYVRTYRSAEMRQRLRIANRRRLGIPDGHVQIYGAHVPEEHAAVLRPYAATIARIKSPAEARAFMAMAKSLNWRPPMPQLTFRRPGTDWDLVEALLEEHMTKAELAAAMGIKEWYLRERLKIRVRMRARGRL